MLLLHHGRTRTSGSGGNRTHVNLLKRQAPSQRRTHFQQTSGPHGSRTRNLPLDRRSLYRMSFWTVRKPAGGGGIEPRRTSRRFWRPSAFPDAITTCKFSTPCGSRTRPKRLERPPTSPEVERGVAIRHQRVLQKKEPAGGFCYPRPARLPLLGSPGVTHSYRSYRSDSLQLAPGYQVPNLTHDRSQAHSYGRPRDTASSQRRRWPSCEVPYSCARGSWLYWVYVVYRVRDGPQLLIPTRGVRYIDARLIVRFAQNPKKFRLR